MTLVALMIFFCTALPASAGAEELDERIPVEPGGVLQVDLDLGEGLRPDRGSLEVRAHDADEVWIVADSSGWGASDVRFRLETLENGVRLYGRVSGALSWMFGGPSVEVRIFVPRRFSVDLRCSAGPIHVEDVNGLIRARTRNASIEVIGSEGRLKLRTTGGSVRVSEIVGEVTIKASDGSVEVSWVKGNVDARTDYGHIQVRHADGRVIARTDKGEIELRDVSGPVEAKTEAGAVYASFVSPPEGVLETRRGSIEVILPEGAGAELDARSGRGTVVLAPGLKINGERHEERAVGRLNQGGRSLRVYTARGTVRVSGR